MAKKNVVKRNLLISLLATVMGASMLVGTTFAWFTDSVTSNGNIIQTGNLDVEMYWAPASETIEDATWTDASETAIFNYDNWEPGYADAKHVQISNKGTLSFQYVVSINANGEVSKLADVIDVYFIDPAQDVIDERTDLDTYAQYKVGTLADVMNGKVTSAKGTLLKGESDIVTIVLKMQDSAGNEYQNLSVGTDFRVMVVATQLSNVEKDAIDGGYDEGALTYVQYNKDITPIENGAVLQAAINNADEGDILLVGAGEWAVKGGNHFAVATDNLTLIGEDGAEFIIEEVNKNSLFDVYGDNVTIQNFEFNKNKNVYNQLILAIGAENLTVDNCTFYGENLDGGNTPTMGIYLFENFDAAGEKGDAITKYTITNNNFLGAAIGSYKGSNSVVPQDPGAVAATVSEEMLIENNTFVGANILIENWRSWSKEANRDHEYVPTIVNNNFVTPNLCLANTPHSIYLRAYRQGNPEKILPEGYTDAFVANNTIAKPTNDTIVNYGGANYVLSNDYGMFYRDNATYGTIAYCYGQSYAKVIEVNTAEEAQAALDEIAEPAVLKLAPNVNYGTLELKANIVLDGKAPVPGNANTEKVDYFTSKYTNEFVRKVENLTIMGAQGATVDAIKFVGNTIKIDGASGGTMYRFVEVKNIVIDGVNFTDVSTIGAGAGFVSPLFVDLSYVRVNGITVKNCTLNGNVSNMNFVYAYGNTTGGCTFEASLKNVVIENNTVSGIARLCELREAENVTIKNNKVSNLVRELALLSNNSGKAYSGNIIVTGNVAENIAKDYADQGRDCLFFRVGLGGDATIVVTGNTITNSGNVVADTFVSVTGVTHMGTLTVENNTLA